MNIKIDSGSFRDSSGRVYIDSSGRIYRTIMPCAEKRYSKLKISGLLEEIIEKKMLVNTWELENNLIEECSYFLEHEKLPIITYPYEWTPSQLKLAAIFHIDFQLYLLEKGWTLTDATAFNIQFIPSTGDPIFIDLLSIRPYVEGEYWIGQNQFCEQFLNPLLLYYKLKIPFNDIYKGTMTGVSNSFISKILPLHKYFSPTLMTNIILPSIIQDKSTKKQKKNSEQKLKTAHPLPKYALEKILINIKNYIINLDVTDKRTSTWSEYQRNNTYTLESCKVKREFISEFCSSVKSHTLWDIGCNSGEYSLIALESGASNVIGIDADIEALDLAYHRAKSTKYNFTPVYSDLSNPSANQGWRLNERTELYERSKPDSILALALIHHLVIGKNIPMYDVIDWITSIASQGVIEFVGKKDETVIEMLAFRDDIFKNYTVELFESYLSDKAKIIKKTNIPNSERVIYWYENY
ncbi:class I SAM-dependent methyltransferase [Vibrio breoganii]|uniref:class I SAM-dependent methyltransferase n=1 Tax=Vibrio breoganii TaxID=553239 RepID=UPI001054F307|nr:class I SAM-dependent methyltransferase [Vibrio breoganii]